MVWRKDFKSAKSFRASAVRSFTLRFVRVTTCCRAIVPFAKTEIDFPWKIISLVITIWSVASSYSTMSFFSFMSRAHVGASLLRKRRRLAEVLPIVLGRLHGTLPSLPRPTFTDAPSGGVVNILSTACGAL